MKNQKTPHAADVADLEKFRGSPANVERRQQVIREKYRAAANYPKEDAAVAGVYIVITGAGKIRTLAINVEPEHVPVFLSEQRKVAQKLRRFATARREKKEAKVVPLRRS